MKFTISQLQVSNPDVFLRRCGYARHSDRYSREISYTKRLGQGLYPRFHIYYSIQENKIVFNLHLDQRTTRYNNQTAHAGEYDSDLVKQEKELILSYAISK